MKGNPLKINTLTSLLYQATAIGCGFLLPQRMLLAYGSEANGLIHSIGQFLQVIAFLELGIGAVAEAALYRPLAEKDWIQVSIIMASARSFFRKIGKILGLYVLVLILIFPILIRGQFDWAYTTLLIIAVSVSLFAEYYFGLADTLLLTADQRGYVFYVTQTAAVIVNTFSCLLLIRLGAGIHMVKLGTALVYLSRPVILRCYVCKHYRLPKSKCSQENVIPQKWNGVAQHISAVVLDVTDPIVLTIFASLSDVSIYGVYRMVVHSVKQLLLSATRGAKALMGNLWAKQAIEELRTFFGWYEWLLHTVVVIIFGCTGVLILPFLSVYTKAVTDAEYIRPLFAVLLTLAGGIHCLRLPYHTLILAAGHFRQTQAQYITAAALNLILSVALVIPLGLVGVALGTVAAVGYQMVWMTGYLSRNLIFWPFRRFLRQLLADGLVILIAAAATNWIPIQMKGYFQWIIISVITVLIWTASSLLVNSILYPAFLTKIIQSFLAHKKL